MNPWKLAGAVGVVVLLLGWTVQSFVVDNGPSRPATAAVAPVSAGSVVAVVDVSPVAAGEFGGVPVGYPATESGAATAAVNWVASFPRLMKLNPLTLQNTLIELLSEDAAGQIVEESVNDYMALFEELGPGFRERVWIESPLQATVLESAATAATVGVWSMIVTGDVDDASPVQALFRTHRITVVWERDDWKIDEIEFVEGPTPVTFDGALPADPAEFAVVDSWDPAVFADTTSAAK